MATFRFSMTAQLFFNVEADDETNARRKARAWLLENFEGLDVAYGLDEKGFDADVRVYFDHTDKGVKKGLDFEDCWEENHES